MDEIMFSRYGSSLCSARRRIDGGKKTRGSGTSRMVLLAVLALSMIGSER